MYFDEIVLELETNITIYISACIYR